jgi:hypothetical protein
MGDVFMKNSENLVQDSIFHEPLPITHTTKASYSLILTFLIIFASEILGFTILRYQIAQALGEAYVVIDIFSILAQIIGALSLTYLYYTRYVKRVLILDKDKVTLKIGKRKYEYSWDEFSFVSLSIASSHIGAKGHSIRLYENDLDGEYVDLPVYRFPTIIDIFDLREKINKKIQSVSKKQRN